LLGGPQAGLIVGRREIIERLRRHSLYRALRVDKLTLAALQATLNDHRRGTAFSEIPTLQMLAMTESEVADRADKFVTSLSLAADSGLTIHLVEGESAIGGGSGPNTHPPTILVALEHRRFSPDEIEGQLRACEPPIISRVSEGKVLLDLRTVALSEEPDLRRAIAGLSR
jgi:L-seryl-tRNA(Ser) seleniumtransferase